MLDFFRHLDSPIPHGGMRTVRCGQDVERRTGFTNHGPSGAAVGPWRFAVHTKRYNRADAHAAAHDGTIGRKPKAQNAAASHAECATGPRGAVNAALTHETFVAKPSESRCATLGGPSHGRIAQRSVTNAGDRVSGVFRAADSSRQPQDWRPQRRASSPLRHRWFPCRENSATPQTSMAHFESSKSCRLSEELPSWRWAGSTSTVNVSRLQRKTRRRVRFASSGLLARCSPPPRAALARSSTKGGRSASMVALVWRVRSMR